MHKMYIVGRYVLYIQYNMYMSKVLVLIFGGVNIFSYNIIIIIHTDHRGVFARSPFSAKLISKIQ